MLKILEAIPGWKAVFHSPKRIDALEARVKALEESRAARSGPGPMDCIKCGSRMRVDAERPDPIFGSGGVMQHTLVCDGCDHTTTRQWTAQKGYE